MCSFVFSFCFTYPMNSVKRKTRENSHHIEKYINGTILLKDKVLKVIIKSFCGVDSTQL